MKTNLLLKSEFKKTFGDKMINITGKEDEHSPEGVMDIMPYVDSIPKDSLEGNELKDNLVESVYRSSDNKYDHVQLITNSKNIYLVVVIDLMVDCIYGHYLLDLNKEYGLTEQ